jgi:hypothetical protein
MSNKIAIIGGESMARGKKTSEDKREQVKAVLYLNPLASQSEIARQTRIPLTTVHEMLKEEGFLDKDKYEELRESKKQEFIGKAFDLAMETLDVIGDKITSLKDIEALKKANIRDLTTALGTLYDKQALASGEPTIISERQEPTPDLVKELEDKIKRLKQLTGS